MGIFYIINHIGVHITVVICFTGQGYILEFIVYFHYPVQRAGQGGIAGARANLEDLVRSALGTVALLPAVPSLNGPGLGLRIINNNDLAIAVHGERHCFGGNAIYSEEILKEHQKQHFLLFPSLRFSSPSESPNLGPWAIKLNGDTINTAQKNVFHCMG